MNIDGLRDAIFTIAKDGARVHQLQAAEDALIDANAELHVALVQVVPSDDELIVEHMRKAKVQIEKALAMVRAAK